MSEIAGGAGESGTEVSGRAGSANVLIVDDRPDNLLALEAALEPLGQNIIRADSGEETLRILLKEEVAVIILDVQMPGLDGFETASYIKQLDRTKHIPILFLTAINKEARHVFKGYSSGAVDYLFKPFDPVVLRSKVHVFVDLHEKTRQLQASEERFRRTFDDAPIGVALVGLEGELIKVNRSLCDLMTCTETDLLTNSIHDLLHHAEESLDLSALAVELSSGGSRHVEKRLATTHGEEKHALIGISFIPSVPGVGPHFIFQITDISERRALENFRESFVSHAAHELRTPATVIAGTAMLLQSSRDRMNSEELNDCITALHRQSERLTKMVANLLDLARLKEGRHVAELRALELSQIANKVLDYTPPPEGTQVDVAIEEGTVALVDAEAVEHVLSNLLVNAYRYGGTRIEMAARRDSEATILSVTDDGPGVPKELIPRLFEPFTRGRSASSVGGSGLGLALVKSLVEASGGEISYEPRSEGGASFSVRLTAPGPPGARVRSASTARRATVQP